MTDDDKTNVYVPGGVASSPDPLVGTILAGKYQIESLLGTGAMGAVYLGRHLALGRQDAIKVLRTDMARDRDAMARFDRGVKNVSAIGHRNVCTIYDFGQTADGLQYVAMELIVGESLAALMDREGPLPTSRVVGIVGQIAAGLQAAHNAGVVHRDLKPANIMLARDADGATVVKVVDFDISKGRDEANAEVTRLGGTVGTPAYMSPEQARGRALNGTSDVYSLALVAFRMLTGVLPFRGDTNEEIRWARTTDAPLRLHDVAPARSFSAELQAVLDRGLERDPAKRTSTAAQFAEQLRMAIAPHSPREAEHTLEQTRASAAPDVLTLRVSRARRTRVAVIAGSVLAVTLGAVYAVQGMLTRGTAAERTPRVADGLPQDSLRQRAPSTDRNGAPPITTADTDAVANKPAASIAREPTVAPKRAVVKPAPTLPSSEGPRPGPPPRLHVTSDHAKAIIDAQRDRLLEPPDPAPMVMRAMRDSLLAVYDLPGVAELDRTRAANLVASLSFALREKAACIKWATLATDRAPNNEGYASRLSDCRTLTP